jgi:hypothetical protein
VEEVVQTTQHRQLAVQVVVVTGTHLGLVLLELQIKVLLVAAM